MFKLFHMFGRQYVGKWASDCLVGTSKIIFGLVKDNKPVSPETGIPPLQEVVSGSGSNTEYIYRFSWITTLNGKRENCQDTPDLL